MRAKPGPPRSAHPVPAPRRPPQVRCVRMTGLLQEKVVEVYRPRDLPPGADPATARCTIEVRAPPRLFSPSAAAALVLPAAPSRFPPLPLASCPTRGPDSPHRLRAAFHPDWVERGQLAAREERLPVRHHDVPPQPPHQALRAGRLPNSGARPPFWPACVSDEWAPSKKRASPAAFARIADEFGP